MEQPNFHNKEPRSREQRDMLHNKDAIEQAQKQAHGAPARPLESMPGSAMYASDEERFSRGPAAAIRQEKEQHAQKKQVRGHIAKVVVGACRNRKPESPGTAGWPLTLWRWHAWYRCHVIKPAQSRLCAGAVLQPF